MQTESSESTTDVTYTSLLADLELLAVLLISFTALFSITGVPAALPSIGSTLQLTESQLGLVMAVFSLPLIVMVPVTGVLADMFGRRVIVLPALALFGVAGLATLFVTSFPELLAIRVLQGIGFTGTVPLTATLIGDRYSGAAGSTAQGMRTSTHGIASTLGPLAAGFLAAIAWNYAFLLFSIALPVFALVYFFYEEPVEDTMEASASFAEIRNEFAGYWEAIRTEAADSTFTLLFGGGFFLFMVKRGIKTFVPVFAVQSVGLSITAGGIILSIYGFVRIVIPPLAGPVVARIGRRGTLVGGFALLALGSGLLPFMSEFVSISVVVGLVAAGDSVVNPVVADTVADLTSEEHRGGIMSGLSVSKELANVVSPVLLGLVITYAGYREMFLLAGAFAVVYGLVFAFTSLSDRGTM